MIRLAIFGSTGSIGKSALEIVRKFPDKFSVICLYAGTNYSELSKQITEFKPDYAGLADNDALKLLKAESGNSDTEFLDKEDAESLAISDKYDVMLASIVGFNGLKSVLNAAKAGKKIALANKESLVAAGKLLTEVCSRYSAELIPVDSEHSAIFQLLQGNNRKDLDSITLTASGGPFLNKDISQFQNITPQEALKHPRWSMGNKISLDSATMFNKALELIEARWLFGLEQKQIEVIVHPQSIIHSMVNFADGSTFAQLSETDMQGPLSFALNYPDGRLNNVLKKLNFAELARLDFLELDHKKFPAVNLAREVLSMGSAAPAVFNFANEYAGQAFLDGRISFCGIFDNVKEVLSHFGSINYSAFEDLLDINLKIQDFMKEKIKCYQP